jgi:DNA-binding HxlR family transcriptional regulator
LFFRIEWFYTRLVPFRYEQFCPVARATEILGQRWTLLILRDLFASGELRFSDLRARLTGISSSVLSERLAQLESQGVVERRELPPPAASTVYCLSEAGRALRPALIEVVRWGMRFMAASRPDDHFDPHWMPMGIEAAARRGPVPPLRIRLRVRTDAAPLEVVVRGGPEGTRVQSLDAAAAAEVEVDAELDVDGRAAVMLAAGVLSLDQAEEAGLAAVAGDRSVVERMPDLFEVPLSNPGPAP